MCCPAPHTFISQVEQPCLQQLLMLPMCYSCGNQGRMLEMHAPEQTFNIVCKCGQNSNWMFLSATGRARGGRLGLLLGWRWWSAVIYSIILSTHAVLTLRMSKAAASAFSLLRQARITRAPLFARPRAAALPMPVLLPARDRNSHMY